MRSSLNRSTDNNRAIELHVRRCKHSLYKALGNYRCNDEMGRNGQRTHVKRQENLLESADAFLDVINTNSLDDPLVKDLISGLMEALGTIVEMKNEVTLTLALSVARKMARILPAHSLDLIGPLASLLSFNQCQASFSSYTLTLILSTITKENEEKVWKILEKRKAVIHLMDNIRSWSDKSMPIQDLEDFCSLLRVILWRWPLSRCYVWSDFEFMEALKGISVKPDCPVKVAVLRLYSAIALCGNGARKVLKNGQQLIEMITHCMDSSNPHSVRIEGFKLGQCLSMDEHRCMEMMNMCCKPMIKAIICGMTSSSAHSGKAAKDQSALLVQACRLALIVRWPGAHHEYFWRLGVDNVLVNLLLNDYLRSDQSEDYLSVFTAQEGLNETYRFVRPYIWDILGWLASHCDRDFNPKIGGNQLCIDILMECACTAFVDSMHKTRYIHLYDVAELFDCEPVSRSVLMMMSSPCTYIASHVRNFLEKVLRNKVKAEEYLTYFLDNLRGVSCRNNVRWINRCQTMVNLIHLVCYSALPKYQKFVINGKGINILLALVKWWLQKYSQCFSAHVRRLTLAPHLSNAFNERTCCWAYTESWGDDDLILLYSLWGLAELIHHLFCEKISDEKYFNEIQLISDLQELYTSVFTPGARYYATYILSHFGLYGVPSKLGKNIGKMLHKKEFSDLDLVMEDKESIPVHRIILKSRCSSLLPHSEIKRYKTKKSTKVTRVMKSCPSASVDRVVVLKVLEFAYTGTLQAGKSIMKDLSTFAKHLNLPHFIEMISGRSPKWGTPIPSFDLTNVLGPAGNCYMDIILEAKANETMDWTCPACPLKVPHMHAHKVIVCSSCAYVHTMLQSEMQESYSRRIKVPISWKALGILCVWFYSGELRKPVSGCLLAQLDFEEQLAELLPYVELKWLSDYWILDDLGEDSLFALSSSVLSVSELNGERLSIKISQFADELADELMYS